jgi:hypothetical protein
MYSEALYHGPDAFFKYIAYLHSPHHISLKPNVTHVHTYDSKEKRKIDS